MPILEWREVARADLLAIVDYISDDNPDAAQRLKDDIEAKAENLLEPSDALPCRAGFWYTGNGGALELCGDLHRRYPCRDHPAGIACCAAMAASKRE